MLSSTAWLDVMVLAVEYGALSRVLPNVAKARPRVMLCSPGGRYATSSEDVVLRMITMSPTTSQPGLLHKNRSTCASAMMRFSLFARLCCTSSLMT